MSWLLVRHHNHVFVPIISADSLRPEASPITLVLLHLEFDCVRIKVQLFVSLVFCRKDALINKNVTFRVVKFLGLSSISSQLLKGLQIHGSSVKLFLRVVICSSPSRQKWSHYLLIHFPENSFSWAPYRLLVSVWKQALVLSHKEVRALSIDFRN